METCQPDMATSRPRHIGPGVLSAGTLDLYQRIRLRNMFPLKSLCFKSNLYFNVADPLTFCQYVTAKSARLSCDDDREQAWEGSQSSRSSSGRRVQLGQLDLFFWPWRCSSCPGLTLLPHHRENHSQAGTLVTEIWIVLRQLLCG